MREFLLSHRETSWLKGIFVVLLFSILFVAGILLLALLAAAHYFYTVGIARGSSAMDVLAARDTLFTGADFEKDENREWWRLQPFEKLAIRSVDGLALKGVYLPAPAPSLKTVIIFHGYRGAAQMMAGFARFYHDELGCNVLLPDARGHGESQGGIIGMGWADRPDVLDWIREAEKRAGPGVKIALAGVSMGGAVVMMAAGEDLPSSVRCVIEDCGYDSVQNEFKHQLKRLYGLPSFPLLPAANLICKLRAGFTFGEASCVAQLKKARVPVLFIHGAEDDFVPPGMMQACFEACASPKRFWLAPGAGHGLAFQTQPEAYKRIVQQWLAETMNGAERP